MNNQLVKYEAACRALAECKSVDEAKGWADKAAAMQAYGRMAKDKTLEVDAAEIRIRAERRLGEMLAATKADGGLSTGTRGQLSGKSSEGLAVVANDHQKTAPKLADAGISKDLSSRAQKLAAVPEHEFESEVGEWRERVNQEGNRVSARLQAAGEREQKKASPGPVIESTDMATADELLAQMEETQAENVDLHERIAIMSADDKVAEIDKLMTRINGLEGRLAQAMNQIRSSEDTTKVHASLIHKLRKLLDVEGHREILAAVTDLVNRKRERAHA